ncbi:hypothetical protein CP8484711_1119A, partial [Chlamydia psittaci 84-8471/1]
MVVFAPIS